MEQVIESLGKKLYVQGHPNTHHGYYVNWKLISPLCKVWSRNRLPDRNRVEEMLSFYKEGGYIPPVIHLAEIQGEGLVCYDGNHRREVLNLCGEDAMCIIDVMFDAKQCDVFMAFDNLNKSIEVPSIYTSPKEDAVYVQKKLTDLVKKYEIKYPKFLSPAKRFHAPNFNRDVLVNDLSEIYERFDGKIDIDELESKLELLNSEYSKENMCKPHSQYPEKTVKKCRESNFWLFIDRKIPFEHLEKIVFRH